MPCNCDYMESTDLEKNLDKVYNLLDEVNLGITPNKKFGTGYDKRVYWKGLTQEHLNEKVVELCSLLQEKEVSKYSLELQIWWRDHQKADKERIEKEIGKIVKELEREQALSKLSDYERKLLNL